MYRYQTNFWKRFPDDVVRDKETMSKMDRAIPIQQSGANIVLVTSAVDKSLHEMRISKFMFYTYIMILTWC